MTTQGMHQPVMTPAFEVPHLACDSHAHVLGPIDAFPYASDRSYTPPDALLDDYLEMRDALSLERAVIVQASVYGTDNSRTEAAVEEMGQSRARGVGMVDASVPTEELQRLHANGIRATRFITTVRGGPTVDQLPAVADRVAEVGWHIEMYVPPEDWAELLPVVEGLPVPIVFDHMAGLPADVADDDPRLVAILDLLERERAWIKLSSAYRNTNIGSPYSDVAPLAQRFIAHAPDRCVWGSDWPHTNLPAEAPDDGELLNLLATWAPDAETRDKILVANPARLYGF